MTFVAWVPPENHTQRRDDAVQLERALRRLHEELQVVSGDLGRAPLFQDGAEQEDQDAPDASGRKSHSILKAAWRLNGSPRVAST